MSTPCPYCEAPIGWNEASARPPYLIGCDQCLNPALVHTNGEISLERVPGHRDFRERIEAGSVLAGVFAQLDDALRDLPVLPEVPQRILTMVHDPLTSMSDLARVVNEDAAITLKILRMANSAFYGGVQEVKDLNVACARLGMRGVVNIVQAVAHSNLYKTNDPRFKKVMQELWRHSIATAHAAELVAARTGQAQDQMPFVAGLVHDVGKLVLLDLITTKYQGPAGRLKESPALLAKVLTVFHPTVGLHVVQRWKQPPEFGVTTFYSPHPDAVPVEALASLTHTVALAEHLANVCGYGAMADETADISAHPSAGYLGIDQNVGGVLRSALEREVEAMLDTVGLG